ncbi:VWA domain-containing protein [Streptomyces lushanensis]|uniref:VWA domain-containing protein n=1 Tax=Streptomyces lushanensis TaxID=1434255 RepID=UPI00099FA2B5
MTANKTHLPEKIRKPGKGRFAASVATRVSGAEGRSPRVMLALPGAHRHPFENGTIADMARRAATLGRALSPGTAVQPWIYTSRAHRLPELDPHHAAQWIADWAALPPEPLLTRDAAPASGNLLTRHAERYGLFNGQNTAEAVNTITASVPEADGPVLVLFYLWAPGPGRTALADQLEAASGANVFWQFAGNPNLESVLNDLDQLRSEAPHITNVNLYRGWDPIEMTPEYLFFRGVLKPFVRWSRTRPQRKN